MHGQCLILALLLFAGPSCAEDAGSGAKLILSDGVTVCIANGDGAALGTAMGNALAERVRLVVKLIDLQAKVMGPNAALVARIGGEHRAELHALAAAAHVDEDALIRGNLLLDSLCTAVVAMPSDGQPLRVARNMDFFPADLLGPATVIQLWRTPGLHAVASIGWPGFVGVISGMNDRGVTACVLQRFDAEQPADGVPLAFQLRTTLERADSLDQAVALFTASLPASGHYVLFADATTACAVWRDSTGMQRCNPADGWLVLANEPVISGKATGSRCTALRQAFAGEHDSARMRQLLTVSYLNRLNAQAMLFEPATRHIDVALGTSFKPACLSPWHSLDLGPLLDGGNGEGFAIQPLPASAPLAHYER